MNGVGDELGVLLDDVLDLLLLEVLELVLLEEEADLGTTAKVGVDSVGGDGEGASSSGLPDVLLVVVVLGDDLDALGDEVGGVETDTELTNHRDVGTGRECLHEALYAKVAQLTANRERKKTQYLRAGLRDRTKVVDEVSLGHTDTRITNGEDLVLLVGDDANVEVLA